MGAAFFAAGFFAAGFLAAAFLGAAFFAGFLAAGFVAAGAAGVATGVVISAMGGSFTPFWAVLEGEVREVGGVLAFFMP